MLLEQGLEPGIYFSPDDRFSGQQSNGLRPGPDQVEVGASLYTFSPEAQAHLFRIPLADFDRLWLGNRSSKLLYPDFERDRSILVINEPHANVTAQFRLFKGLEVFFRDNPGLTKRTAFLIEGFPANQEISVRSLIEADPNPSDELIKEVLSSFLITGPMAYEWKHQKGIPMIGVEDSDLYALSRDYAILSSAEPEGVFYRGPIPEMEAAVEKDYLAVWRLWERVKKGSSERGTTRTLVDNVTVTVTDELVWNIQLRTIWNLLVIARNAQMAQTAIQQSQRYENPMLFVGNGHVVNNIRGLEFDVARALMVRAGPQGPLGTKGWAAIANSSNLGIYHYLKNRRIGFTFLDPEKLGDQQDRGGYYQRLFQTQQNVEMRGGDYSNYVDWLMRQRSLKKTTVKPSPETAADLVRRIKEKQKTEQQSGVVYEHKEEVKTERPGWFKTGRDEVWAALQKDTLWGQPMSYQGRDYEKLRGATPASNLKTVDDLRLDARTVTGMKTIDLTASTYQDIRNLESRVSHCIDELSGYQGGSWQGQAFYRGKDFDEVYLELGVPAGRVTSTQIDKLVELQDYAQTQGVTLVINEVP